MKEYTVKVYDNGDKKWYLNGLLHREDGPALEYTCGTKQWLVGGKFHREDGPAREWADGTKEWWLNGVYCTEAEWKAKLNPKPFLGKKVVVDGIEYTLG